MLDNSLPDARPLEERAITRPLAQTANRRLWLIALLIPALLLLVVAGVAFGYNLTHQNRVFEGVSVGDVGLGGKSEAEARAALTARYGSVTTNRAGLVLNYAGKDWKVNADEIGLRFDLDRSVAEAMAVGRSNNLFADLGSQWAAWGSKLKLQPNWQYNQANLPTLLGRLHQDIDKPSVNAVMSIAPDGQLSLTDSQSGLQLDDTATTNNITTAALQQSGSDAPHADIVVSSLSPAITSQHWEAAHAAVATMLHPVTLVYAEGKFSYTFSAADIAKMIKLNPPQGAAPANASLDPAPISAIVSHVAGQVDDEASDAVFLLNPVSATVTVKPDHDGRKLDQDATLNAITHAITNPDNRTVTLPVATTLPLVHAADLEPARAHAADLMNKGFNLNYQGGPWSVKGERMAVMLQLIRDDSSGRPVFSIGFDQAELARKLKVISTTTDHPASDPLYRLGPENIAYVASPGVDGRVMDVPATIAAVNKALAANQLSADVQFKVDPAASYDISQPLSFPDVLAHSVTDLSASAPARKHNVTLGTDNFNNTLIPPGATYSASDAFGPIDEAHGFQTGFAIVSTGNGNISTQPAVGGGICQVATTFFQSAWWTGLQVVERHNHQYWIGTYGYRALDGLTPLGRTGLDATVYQYDVDLKVKNTTGNWVLVRSWVSPSVHVNFELLGTNPHWTISVSDPIVTNRVPSTSQPITETSDLLPYGSRTLVEHHQDGFDASISRTVTDASGKVLDKITLNSHYVPAHDRYLIGTKGAPPTAPATPTPAPGQPPVNPTDTVPVTPTPTPKP